MTNTISEDVYLDAWGYLVTVIWSADAEQERVMLADGIGTKYEPSIPSRGTHLFHPSESRSWMVFSPEADAGTIAHECWHAIRAMLEWCGASLDNETVAYHLGFLVLETYRIKSKFESRKPAS